MFELPAGHHGVEDGCGVMDYDDLTKKGKKRDAETIAKIMESDFKFNEGLYQRALMIMDSADDGFTFCIPLKIDYNNHVCQILWFSPEIIYFPKSTTQKETSYFYKIVPLYCPL